MLTCICPKSDEIDKAAFNVPVAEVMSDVAAALNKEINTLVNQPDVFTDRQVDFPQASDIWCQCQHKQ